MVSLSTDDPPVLTAVAAGDVTITAGPASADVTVSAVALPLGTVIWSNPGNASGVYSIVPAVPSSSGVADVFAFQNDGSVQAITSDGTTAWTADVSQAAWWAGGVVPDFQGGLVSMEWTGNGNSLVKLDGITGQRYAAFTGDGTLWSFVPHPDGTIIAATSTGLVGINPHWRTEIQRSDGHFSQLARKSRLRYSATRAHDWGRRVRLHVVRL